MESTPVNPPAPYLGGKRRLAAQLAGIKGRFLMSLNDTPEIREIFAAFRIDAVETSYSVGKQQTEAAEVLIPTEDQARGCLRERRSLHKAQYGHGVLYLFYA